MVNRLPFEAQHCRSSGTDQQTQQKEKIEHTERTILENEIIYVLICFEQSAQILLGHTKRWWCIQRWRWRENWPQLHQRQANTHQSHVCVRVCCWCVLWHEVFTWRQIINEKIRLSPSLNRFWAILLMPSNPINWCSFASLHSLYSRKMHFPHTEPFGCGRGWLLQLSDSIPYLFFFRKIKHSSHLEFIHSLWNGQGRCVMLSRACQTIEESIVFNIGRELEFFFAVVWLRSQYISRELWCSWCWLQINRLNASHKFSVYRWYSARCDRQSMARNCMKSNIYRASFLAHSSLVFDSLCNASASRFMHTSVSLARFPLLTRRLTLHRDCLWGPSC